MKYSAVAVVAPLLAGQAAALGNAIIKNLCAETVTYWEVGDSTSSPQTIAQGGSISKQFYNKAGGGGVSYKIAGEGGSLGGPITQFELTIDYSMSLIFWDISNVNGGGNPPFVAGGITVTGGSMTKTCAAGQNPCNPKEGYTKYNDDWATASSGLDQDVTMELCGPNPGVSLSGGSGSSGNNNQQANSSPSPASSSSPAPSPTQAPSADNVNNKLAKQPSPSPSEVDVTVVVTVTAPDAVVTTHMAGQQKRDGHIHNHAHAHNKFNKRRHGA